MLSSASRSSRPLSLPVRLASWASNTRFASALISAEDGAGEAVRGFACSSCRQSCWNSLKLSVPEPSASNLRSRAAPSWLVESSFMLSSASRSSLPLSLPVRFPSNRSKARLASSAAAASRILCCCAARSNSAEIAATRLCSCPASAILPSLASCWARDATAAAVSV